jgi:hypothetical protein
MKTALLAALSALVVGLSACGGSDSTPSQGDFDRGSTATTPPTDVPVTDVMPYPSGPYGTGLNSTVANLKFLGWHAPPDVGYDTGRFENLSLAEYYNPDGSKPIKAIWLNSSAVWCTACQAEYSGAIGVCDGTYNSCTANADCGAKTCVHNSMAEHYTEMKDKGVVFVGTLFEDGKNPPGPAKPSDLEYWGSKYDVNFPLVLDPGFKMGGFFTSDAVPMSVVIDTKTMKVTAQILGGDPGGVVKALVKIVNTDYCASWIDDCSASNDTTLAQDYCESKLAPLVGLDQPALSDCVKVQAGTCKETLDSCVSKL